MTVCSLAMASAGAGHAQQDGGEAVLCPDQLEGVPPGVYAAAIQKTITLSKDDETVVVDSGRTGFADEPRLTCLNEIPEFIRRDRIPAPGEFSALGAACGFSGGGNDDDIGLSSEWPRMERRFADEIERFVKNGYPPSSIIMHAVASGLTVDKTVYLMTRADTDRAEEFFNAAFAMQDSLPGWACGADSDSSRGGPYSPYYGVNDLPPKRTIAEVARRYFEELQIVEPMPNWFGNDFHMLAYTDELVELASDGYWYRRGSRPAIVDGRLQKPILVGLYGESGNIVLDVSRDDLLALQQTGVERLPVVFYFNKDFQRAVTDFGRNPTLSEVIDRFESDGIELTPAPLLSSGDFHFMVPIDDLDDMFDIPRRSEIDPARFDSLSESLSRDGFDKQPIVITLYSEQQSRWLDDPARVRAAIEAGHQEIPVALLYHRMRRLPCGATPSCVRRVCEALTCAGGAPSACQIDPALQREAEPITPPPSSEGGFPSDS